MMQPANLRHRYHTPALRRLHRPTLWQVLLQRQMRSTLVIILQERLQMPTQGRFVEDDPMVQTLEQPTRLQILKGESPFSVNYLYSDG